jgi:hypothetical protein
MILGARVRFMVRDHVIIGDHVIQDHVIVGDHIHGDHLGVVSSADILSSVDILSNIDVLGDLSVGSRFGGDLVRNQSASRIPGPARLASPGLRLRKLRPRTLRSCRLRSCRL